MAVIAAFKLDGEVSVREAARQPQGAHHRFGAGVHETDHLDAGHGGANFLGEINLLSVGAPKLVPEQSTSWMASLPPEDGARG